MKVMPTVILKTTVLIHYASVSYYETELVTYTDPSQFAKVM